MRWLEFVHLEKGQRLRRFVENLVRNFVETLVARALCAGAYTALLCGSPPARGYAAAFE